MAGEEEHYGTAERRIEWRTLIVGAVAGAVVMGIYGRRSGLAVFCGTLLSWLNFRLLSRVAGTMASLISAQTGPAMPRVPRKIYVKLLGLLALLLLAAYVMLAVFKLPVLPLLGGLLAVVPAIAAELVTELTPGRGASGQS